MFTPPELHVFSSEHDSNPPSPISEFLGWPSFGDDLTLFNINPGTASQDEDHQALDSSAHSDAHHHDGRGSSDEVPDIAIEYLDDTLWSGYRSPPAYSPVINSPMTPNSPLLPLWLSLESSPGQQYLTSYDDASSPHLSNISGTPSSGVITPLEMEHQVYPSEFVQSHVSASNSRNQATDLDQFASLSLHSFPVDSRTITSPHPSPQAPPSAFPSPCFQSNHEVNPTASSPSSSNVKFDSVLFTPMGNDIPVVLVRPNVGTSRMTEVGLSRRRINSTGKYQCPYCQKTFTSKDNLECGYQYFAFYTER
ncbi:hypothetical protein BDQ17DRAFT_1426481 [Cyathus striatus]|nr:hypothetical protein BDQ17DRAFT_1426481 [Cyathus striatus]